MASDAGPSRPQAPQRCDSPLSHATGVHRPSGGAPPRLRTLARAQIFNDASPAAPPMRRRSSILSDFSLDDTRHSVFSSTDNLLLPRVTSNEAGADDEPSHWQSLPLAFAILPPLAGLLFHNGSAFVTDVLLLGLAAIFLNWSVRLPWNWYYSALAVQVVDEADDVPMSTIIEDSEDEGNEHVVSTSPETVPEDMPGDDVPKQRTPPEPPAGKDAALKELRKHEYWALLLCFLGPMMGAYLLHAIRSQLSRPSESLISNYNLTIFLLAAELRPCSHLIKLMQARTLHLQRVVKPGEESAANKKQEELGLVELSKRVDEMEGHFAERATYNSSEVSKERESSAQLADNVRLSLQPQVDALNRAVRRYERRATTQTLQTEARLQDLEKRLQDALALAAAAAKNSQKPSFATNTLTRATRLFILPFQMAWMVGSYPFQIVNTMFARTKSFLFDPRPRRKRSQARSADPGRVPFRSGRRSS
ncbi:hypothetical protein BDY21DRAFT_367887 [Lineolata rhizophorae]|uniref:Uncharacterized protein n=1 Tax=Lineolata rhizophorae TaxID=578093 RepID=A0A6A6NLB2_9PEZI|nr:hypothetical protein BDY21DRAFT_367887 [Lineolata rhizophorae]